jgi:hypothetical protein
MNRSNPFAEAQDLLRRLNALVYEGKPLSEQKIFDKYNVWQFYQTRLFFADLKRALTGYSTEPVPSSLKDFVLGLLTLAISTSSYLWSLVFHKQVLVYSVDRTNSKVAKNDARIDGLYLFLEKFKITYFEYFHTNLDRSLLERFFKRGRGAVYIRALDTLIGWGEALSLIKNEVSITGINFSNFSEAEQKFIKPLVFKYLQSIKRSEQKVKILRALLRWQKPKMILSIDNTRDYNELVLAAKLENIAFFAFQHSHCTKYHVGWLKDSSFTGEIVHPDRLYVWSEFWKEEFLRLGTYFSPEELVVGGVNRPALASRPPRKKPDGSLNILIPYEIDSLKDEVKNYLDDLLQHKHIKIYFKLRTDISREGQIEDSLLKEDYNPRLCFVTETEAVISQVDVVAGTYSTFLYDMIAFNKPIALLDTPNDFGDGLVINGLAERVRRDANLIENLKKVALTLDTILDERREKLYDAKPQSLSQTLESLGREFGLIHEKN